jgi:hypothetical protein
MASSRPLAGCAWSCPGRGLQIGKGVLEVIRHMATTTAGSETPRPATNGGGDQSGGAHTTQGALRRTSGDVLWPIVSATGTSLGLLGFVTVFGAAIMFFRLDAVHLPAAQAVALIPTSVLLVTGAHFLLGALLLALGAVAVLWLYDQQLSGWLQKRADARALANKHSLDEALGAVAVAEDAFKKAAADLRATISRRKAARAAAVGASAPVYVQAARAAEAEVDQAKALARTAQDELEEVLAQHRDDKAEVDKSDRQHRQRVRVRRALALVAPVLILELVLTGLAGLPRYDYLLLTVVAVATSMFSLVI